MHSGTRQSTTRCSAFACIEQVLRRLASRLRKFCALAREDRSAVLHAALLLPLYSASLALRRNFDFPAHPHAASRGDVLDTPRARRIAWAVNAAALHSPVGATCLARSLVLLHMLHGRGTLRIGVRAGRGCVEAHSWVEWDGVPLNDRADIGEQFAILHGPAGAATLR